MLDTTSMGKSVKCRWLESGRTRTCIHTHLHTYTYIGGDYHGRENQKILLGKKQADSNLHEADTERGHALDGIKKIIDVSHDICKKHTHMCESGFCQKQMNT
jgi:hypothetical protein